ncbi:hypothetical protein D3C75_894740 [compost metagenome]
MLTDFKADLLVSQVGFGTIAVFFQLFGHLRGKFALLVGDVQHHRLGRRQPGREGTLVVLDEDPDETLEGTEHGTVQHHRVLAAIILTDVLGPEADRQIEVELQGTALPDSPQAILQRELDLRAVEGALARLQLPRQAGVVQRGL